MFEISSVKERGGTYVTANNSLMEITHHSLLRFNMQPLLKLKQSNLNNIFLGHTYTQKLKTEQKP